MKITVRIKENRYGHKDIWPADDNAKKILAQLSGGNRKCFSQSQIEFIKTSGIEVVEMPNI